VRARLQPRARTREALGALEGAALDLGTLVHSVGRILARSVPYDGACWHTIDPITLVETSSYLEHLRPNARGASEIEYLHSDFNKFSVLARSARKSGILSEATGGDPTRSERYRLLVAPEGLEGELRASFVVDGACWGSVGLFREAPRDFDADEAAFLHEVAPSVARAFRAAAVRGTYRAGEGAPGPGLVLFDADRWPQAVTQAAYAWLEQLGWDRDGFELPYVVYTVADEARRIGSLTGQGSAVARVRARDGGWVELHAATAGAGNHHIAVILDASKPTAIAPLLQSAYGLSKRERDVTELVLRGTATAEIAERLKISRSTVQQHLKVVFAKVGVHSRRELIAQVFLGHHSFADPPKLTSVATSRGA
jgi:DNA-binding CsgD family transcriptional regulator